MPEEFHLQGENAAQPIGEGRNAARHHPGVGNGNQITGERLFVLCQKPAQAFAAALLLALHQKNDVHRQVARLLQRFFHAQDVGQNLPLVIRRAAGIYQAVLEGGLKGGSRPLIQRVGGLHVVMPVNEQRPAARLACAARHHNRVPVGGINLRLQPHGAEFLFEPPGARGHLWRVLRIRRNALKPEKLEKFGKIRGGAHIQMFRLDVFKNRSPGEPGGGYF